MYRQRRSDRCVGTAPKRSGMRHFDTSEVIRVSKPFTIPPQGNTPASGSSALREYWRCPTTGGTTQRLAQPPREDNPENTKALTPVRGHFGRAYRSSSSCRLCGTQFKSDVKQAGDSNQRSRRHRQTRFAAGEQSSGEALAV